MGPPAARGSGGTVVRLDGWGRTKLGRYLAASFCILAGVAAAGALYLLSLMFSMWGSGPGTAEALMAFACIAGGVAMAGAVIWPILGSEGPHLVLDERRLRFHHPDLVADMVIEREAIIAIHADYSVGVPVFLANEMGLNTFDGANLAMVFRTPQHIPRARIISQLNPFFSMRVGRSMSGLRLRVEDVEWARRVFGTMPQYRALTDDDYAQAAIQARKISPQQLIFVGVAIALFIGSAIVEHLL